VSGHYEPAKRTGAQIYLGAGSGATFPPLAGLLYDSLHGKLLTLSDNVREQFVQILTANRPARPEYFARDVESAVAAALMPGS
jgi:hypothetical protein